MGADESRLVKKAQAGSVAAVTKLLKRHYQAMYTTAYAYVHNQQDALDVVQEASMRVVQRLNQLQDPALFGTWLTRIVMNEATRLIGKQAQTSGVELDEWVSAPDSNQEAKFAVGEALNKVDARYAQVLRLYYFSGHSIREIAAMIDVNDNTVKTRLARGRQALKLALEEE